MNYEKHYKLLCQTRQQLNRQKLSASHADYVYYELHHIVPRHEAGSDEASNLVLLTAREHFIAHWLFAKWKQTSKAWAALCAMRYSNTQGRQLNSRQYEICRIANSIQAKMSQKYERTNEHKIKMSKALANRAFSESHKLAIKNARIAMADIISARMKGSNNPAYGKPGTFLGCKHSDSARLKMTIANFNRAQNRAYCSIRAEKVLIAGQILVLSKCNAELM
jgi:hypothetical protein